MANKTTLQRLRLDPYFSKTIATNLNVWSHDINSYEIKFEFYDSQCDKPIDLTGADMRILLDHEGSQPKVYPLEIESKILGLAKFVMPEQIRGCEGKFTAHIYADYPNHTNDFGHFMFYTKISRIDGNMDGCLDTVYVSEFEKALQDIKNKSSQFDNVEEELNKRIDVIEKDITSNEIVKQNEFANLKQKVDSSKLGVSNLLPVMNDLWVNGYYDTEGKITFSNNDTAFKGKINLNYKEYIIQLLGAETLLTGGSIVILSYDENDNMIHRERVVPVKSNKSINVIKKQEKASYIKLSLPIPLSKLSSVKVKLEQGNMVSDFTTAEDDLVKKNQLIELEKELEKVKKAITTLGGTL